MTKLLNKTTINAPVEKIWQVLASVGGLDKYDPTGAPLGLWSPLPKK